MTDPRPKLPKAIEVYEVGRRRLYAKTGDRIFAIFEDDLSPEELVAIAGDIAARQAETIGQGIGDPALREA